MKSILYFRYKFIECVIYSLTKFRISIKNTTSIFIGRPQWICVYIYIYIPKHAWKILALWIQILTCIKHAKALFNDDYSKHTRKVLVNKRIKQDSFSNSYNAIILLLRKLRVIKNKNIRRKFKFVRTCKIRSILFARIIWSKAIPEN